jgi:hypothetical protein
VVRTRILCVLPSCVGYFSACSSVVKLLLSVS